jgi:hypothetical protein
VKTATRPSVRADVGRWLCRVGIHRWRFLPVPRELSVRCVVARRCCNRCDHEQVRKHWSSHWFDVIKASNAAHHGCDERSVP